VVYTFFNFHVYKAPPEEAVERIYSACRAPRRLPGEGIEVHSTLAPFRSGAHAQPQVSYSPGRDVEN
jgi:hypothetical protein